VDFCRGLVAWVSEASKTISEIYCTKTATQWDEFQLRIPSGAYDPMRQTPHMEATNERPRSSFHTHGVEGGGGDVVEVLRRGVSGSFRDDERRKEK
jgi:hypothetical protein